ncbi:hypothetical protein VPHK389_0034 [Vibrio phage K389]
MSTSAQLTALDTSRIRVARRNVTSSVSRKLVTPVTRLLR